MTTRKPSDDAASNRPRRAKAPARPLVTAAFTMSWDGRIIGWRPPQKPVDAVLCGSDAGEWNEAGDAARVLVHATGRLNTGARFFQAGSHPVIVYSTVRMARAALAAMPNVRLHLRAEGAWPLRDALEHLRSTHGVRRVAFAGEPELFRALALEGLLDELCLAWRPILLGAAAPTLTGPEKNFLPRGIVLDLLKLDRTPDECVARYRVHTS